MEKKKKITVEIDERTLKTLHNAITAYLDVIYALKMHCDVNPKFEVLGSLGEEELHKRNMCIVDLYRQIEEQFLDVA